MSGLGFPPWLPALPCAAVNIGVVKVSAQSGGSVNFGVTSVGQGGGGGSSSNQLVGISGNCGLSWINVGLMYSTGAIQGGGAQPADGSSPESAARPRLSPAAGRTVDSAGPATFRFRWDDPGAEARTGAAKEGRHARRPSAAPRRHGGAARNGAPGGAAR